MKGNVKASTKKQFVDRQVAEFTAKDPGTGELIKKHLTVLDMVREYSHPNSYVLDVGCSNGKILKSLSKVGYQHLYAVDIQDKSVSAFRGTNIHFRALDVEQERLPFKAKFDVIIFSDVLEHFFSPQTVLYDLLPSLSPHGKIIFSVPNSGWFVNGPLLTFFPAKLFVSTAFGPWGHTYHFTFFQVQKLASNLKLKIRELTGGPLDNYAFKTGLKKLGFDLFAAASFPLLRKWPNIFSAHIFGVLEKSNKKLNAKARFDVGV
ncbi:hypothetical protein A2618_02565 [Candidatus Collierbacteria bacterium RIFOXYD1_FULL_46_26]|uniref:Methyltransferase type 11 domain-containing protein n=1 Tax=Candidatus Collierbacteria bacterium RIFOXYD1_FULL_46_26 TaxID=1817732 RepID=A0A1F5FZD5_9BACT|nr:MAG: hypothetical protein A2618_02565 [Candidatus Collierbacteria bacterium RIFOXYD1_FULL_46_26]